MTVFCGPNNSGKTWAMYALHAFYSLAKAHHFKPQTPSVSKTKGKQAKKELRAQEGKTLISFPNFHKILNAGLADYFNLPKEAFKNVKFKCNYSEKDWLKWIKNYQQPNVFLMPAERNGIHLFYRELSNRRTTSLHDASPKDINIHELLNVSHYAQPIADYIDWLNNLVVQKKTSKKTHNEFHKEALFLQKGLAEGRYNLNLRTGDLTYKPYTKGKVPAHVHSLHAASGTVKSLFSLWFYLEHQAKPGDIVMIDDPELNIHPGDQLVITHLLARLVNAGIQVVISTHSDYIVREFNNLVMLSEDSTGELLNSLNKEGANNYKQDSILKPDQVSMYLFDNNTIEPFDFKRGEGFAVSTFDEVIVRQNESSNRIYHGIKYGDING